MCQECYIVSCMLRKLLQLVKIVRSFLHMKGCQCMCHPADNSDGMGSNVPEVIADHLKPVVIAVCFSRMDLSGSVITRCA